MISVAIAKILWRCPFCFYEREASDFEMIAPLCPHGCENGKIYYSRDHCVPRVAGPIKEAR